MIASSPLDPLLVECVELDDFTGAARLALLSHAVGYLQIAQPIVRGIGDNLLELVALNYPLDKLKTFGISAEKQALPHSAYTCSITWLAEIGPPTNQIHGSIYFSNRVPIRLRVPIH